MLRASRVLLIVAAALVLAAPARAADPQAAGAVLADPGASGDRKAEAARALLATEGGRTEAAAILAEGTDASAVETLVAALKDPGAEGAAKTLAGPLARLLVRTKIALARQGQRLDFILNPTVVQDLARVLSALPPSALHAAFGAALTSEAMDAWTRAVHAQQLGPVVGVVEQRFRDRLAEIGDPRGREPPYGFRDEAEFAAFRDAAREDLLARLGSAAAQGDAPRMTNEVLGFDAVMQTRLFPFAMRRWEGAFRTVLLHQQVDSLGADTMLDYLASLPEEAREALFAAFREEAGERAERWARAALGAERGSYREIAREELRAAVNASPGPEGAWWTPAPPPSEEAERPLPAAAAWAACAAGLAALGFPLLKAGHPKRWAKPAIFTLVAVFMVLGTAEGALRLLGIEAEDEREDPFYGLSPDYKLFKKTRLESGEDIYETNFNKQSSYDYFNFNYQTFPTPKAPGGFRVFTLGGSSVYGVPYGDKESFSRRLEGKLRAAHPGRPIEVVNTGGAGYETERIRILVRELLEYEPDLFILYVGHNEFLNHFYRPGSADFAEKFSTARIYLNRLRLYALLRRPIVDLKYRLGRGGDAPDADDDEPRSPADSPLVQVLDGGVIRRKYHYLLDAYARNLTAIVREAEARGVRVILSTVGSNQLVPPNGSVHFKSLSAEEEKAWAEAYAAGADLYRRATEGGAANSWEATPEQRALLERARARLERAAAVDDTFAQLSFYRGQVYGRLGDWARAREMFQRCLWEDARPNRAPMALNDAVRVIARVEGTAFVDAYAALAARAPGGVLGPELFADYVHPNPEGHEIIANALLAEIERRGWIE